jgi:Tfp pilus tip-associated adhesin PilY1
MKIFVSVVFITILTLTGFVQSYADDMDVFSAGISPDALIVFDLSVSMNWVIDGTMYIQSSQICNPLSPSPVAYYPTYGTLPISHTKPCTITNFASFPKYGDPSCSGTGGFFTTWTQANTWYGSWADCSRLANAKRAIFGLLDDNKDSLINIQDETSVGIRLGFMRFRGGDDIAGDYYLGNIRLGKKNTSGCTESTSSADALGLGSSYNDIFNRINCETANSNSNLYSMTPLASSLNEAKLYLDANKAADSAGACRKKFVILVTDGEDTYACTGNGQDGQTTQYMMRRESVAKAKALADGGYKVFVVGFGANVPDSLKNTLNWMAYYGGTDNPLVANLGNTSQYSIPSGSFYPSGITGCQDIASPDPGGLSLSGYAFFAQNASQLSTALTTIKNYIQQESQTNFSYSYSGSVASSVRVTDGNTVYIPSSEIPSWNGNLRAYQLNADGTLPIDAITHKITAAPIWSAGEKLNQKNPDDRKILTYSNGTLKTFLYANLTNVELGLPSDPAYDTARQSLINYVRGVGRAWKLGDILHSSPVFVGEPSRFFDDEGFNGTGGFYQANKDRTKVVIVGANDGMLHAFNASTGDEQWGFIPNSVLTSLQSMMSLHTYYVDSSPKVADAWFYNTSTDGTKSADEWKTVLVCGLRKGGKINVVLGTDSNNYTCIKDHTAAAENRPITGASWATYWAQQGTGGGTWVAGGYFAKTWRYFALDITDTLNPKYLWEFPKSTDLVTLAKVGQSWSEPVTGRVKMEDPNCDGETCTKADSTKPNYDPNHRHFLERWVVFIGGGFDLTNNTGKAFFVVDVKTGDIIKEFSGLVGMNYSFAAPPTAVDVNSDGFIDKVYIGDLGGQMWVFDVSFNGTTKKSESQWTGQRLFAFPVSDTENTGKHRIYYPPAVAFDRNMIPWVYFGTGDREFPNDLLNPNERFYAVKDSGAGNYPKTEDTDLLNVTSLNTFTPTSIDGWYVKLAKNSQTLEKVLAKPVVFNRLVYFTTYSPVDPCSMAGQSKLYIVEYLSGGGALEFDSLTDLEGSPSAQRSKNIGTGVPSAPVITVDVKGQASVTVGTTSDQVLSAQIFSPSKSKETLYWREVIP